MKVPSLDGPQVGSRALAAPQIRQVQSDYSDLQVFDHATQLATGAVRQQQALAQREVEKADTASLMDAEAQMSQFKLDTMFNPDGGVYTKKGKSALDITNQTLPLFDKRAEEIGSTLTNDNQRARWAQITSAQRRSLNAELNQYEHTERNVYYDNTDKANIATSQEGAIAYATDPDQIAYYASKQNAVIASMGARKGWPPEMIQQEQLKASSTMSVGVISRMAQQDPQKAQQYFAGVQPMMQVEDQEKISKLLNTSVRQQMGVDIADKIWSTGTVGPNGLVAAVIQKESAGQTDAVSPKGARGMMQLMPDTAREMAEELNLPFSEERLTSDPNYNITLGTAYLNKMLGRYGGNQALAVAAYNAGPGKVDDWLKENGDPRTGEISEQDWAQKIPYKETRDYTIGLMSQVPQARASASQNYADGQRVLASIKDPELRKFTKDALENRKAVADADSSALYDKAAEYVRTGGYSKIPADLSIQIKPDDLVKLQRMDEHLRKGTEPKTDYNKFRELLAMQPGELAKLNPARDMQPFLNKTDFTTAMNSWEAAQKGDGTVKGVAKAENDMVEGVMNRAGILTGDSKEAKSTNNLEKQDQFRASLQAMKDSWSIKNDGKQPTVEETTFMAQSLLLDAKLSRAGIWDKSGQQIWQVAPEKVQDMYIDKGDITIKNVPPETRQKIIIELRKRGENVTEANIVTNYISGLSGLGVGIK